MKDTLRNYVLALSALLALGGGAGIAALASAQSIDTDTPAAATTSATAQTGDHRWMGPRGMGRGHGVHGSVSAINGTTLTITNTDGTSYTVDASNATASKVVSLSVSDIQVGDTIGVMGEVSGTKVVASHIMDGIPEGQGPPTDN